MADVELANKKAEAVSHWCSCNYLAAYQILWTIFQNSPLGDPWLLSMLGQCYEFLKDCEDDKEVLAQIQKKTHLSMAQLDWNIKDMVAMTSLAHFYYYGIGIDKNLRKAFAYYNRAEELPLAQCHIGRMYHFGQGGLPVDHIRAFHYYTLASNDGDVGAQALLGYMYSQGQGIPQDHLKAFHFYQMAANKGFMNAQMNLGVMYETGQGVPQSFEKAFQFYRLAADQGYVDAQYNLGRMYRHGTGVAQDLEKAVHYYTMAAEHGYTDAIVNLGALHGMGVGVPQDYTKAQSYLMTASKRGDTTASTTLDKMQRKGLSTNNPRQQHQHSPSVAQPASGWESIQQAALSASLWIDQFMGRVLEADDKDLIQSLIPQSEREYIKPPLLRSM